MFWIIQGRYLHEREIRARWYHAINNRLTINKVTVTKIRRTHIFMKLVEETWELALRKTREIPANWIDGSEVLVGRTA